MTHLNNLKQLFQYFDANNVRGNIFLQNDGTLLNIYHDVIDELYELEDEISQFGINVNQKIYET